MDEYGYLNEKHLQTDDAEPDTGELLKAITWRANADEVEE